MSMVAEGAVEATKSGSDADLAARYRAMMAKSKARSATHRETQKGKGLVRVAVWVPADRRGELVDIARAMGGGNVDTGSADHRAEG